MAGHAPQSLPARRRFERWLGELSDVRVSLYMLTIAGTVAAILYLVNRQFFM